MHNIKKFQYPWEGLTPATNAFSYKSNSLDKYKKILTSSGPSFAQQEANKSGIFKTIDPSLNFTTDYGLNGSTVTPETSSPSTPKISTGTTQKNPGMDWKKGASIAASYVDPVLGLTEGIAKGFGANFAEKDAVTGVVDTLAPVADMLVPGLGTGLKVLDFTDRALGKNIKSFQGNTGIAGYDDFSVAGGKLRLSQFGKSKSIQKDKEIGKKLYSAAMTNVNEGRKKATAAMNFAANPYQTTGGFNTSAILAKNGAKINPKELSNIKKKAQRNIKKLQEGTPTDDLQKMQDGGKFNVIPEGALHARKHNLPEEIAEFVTDKGIPVITYEEGGDIKQHAEIENSEIIFNLEVSKQLEELEEEYNKSDDPSRKKELELLCGKLLTYEILENTEDNVGLITTVE